MCARLRHREQGFWLGIGQVFVVGLLWLMPDATEHHTGWLAVIVAITALHALGAALGRRAPTVARVLVTIAWTVAMALAVPWLGSAPLRALLVALVYGAAMVSLWNLVDVEHRAGEEARRDRPASLLVGAALSSGGLWLVGVVLGLAQTRLALAAVTVSGGVGLALLQVVVLRYEPRLTSTRLPRWCRRWPLAAAPVAAVVSGVSFALGAPAMAATVSVLPGLVGGAFAHHRRARRPLELGESLWSELVGDPAVTMVVTFLVLGTLGGLLLTSPACHTLDEGSGIQLIDAMFTAFSATCVTGLAVLDTGRDFTLLGQGVILALIQLGGLGIMTFSAAVMLLLGRRLRLRHETTMVELLGTSERHRMFAALKRIFTVTALTEGIGAVSLWALFVRAGDGVAQGLWRGVFTSISAFCNAGFSLQSDSLVAYQHDPAVLHVVALLILIGGLGPAAIVGLSELRAHSGRTVGLRLIWLSTAVLVIVPFALILAVENDGSLAELSTFDSVHNAWFQSVTLRTAGFNSVDFSQLRTATVVTMMAVMFVGGSPGSTAGGIKTTTLAMLVLVLRASARGESHVRVFGFQVPQDAVYRAASIVALGAGCVLLWLVMIALTQPMALQVALFEVVSALATVGLSTGGTGQLDAIGKVLILVAMFAGRVGPLTLVAFLSQRRPDVSRVTLPEQEVAVG